VARAWPPPPILCSLKWSASQILVWVGDPRGYSYDVKSTWTLTNAECNSPDLSASNPCLFAQQVSLKLWNPATHNWDPESTSCLPRSYACGAMSSATLVNNWGWWPDGSYAINYRVLSGDCGGTSLFTGTIYFPVP
jgi:hypothetical protein